MPNKTCRILTHTRTPKALNEALPNAERGIFHIQNAQYWAFYNLEYAETRPLTVLPAAHPSTLPG
jgi:hypothetical protein